MWTQRHTHGECKLEMKTEIRVKLLQAEKSQGLPTNHQEPGERPGADPLSQPQKKPTLPTP